MDADTGTQLVGQRKISVVQILSGPETLPGSNFRTAQEFF
jgi:hypothetical protein